LGAANSIRFAELPQEVDSRGGKSSGIGRGCNA
jgi:hypothetical protein